MKVSDRLSLYFLLPVILIACLTRVSDTSRSQSKVGIQPPASGQTSGPNATEEKPTEVVARLMVEGGAEFRVVYDRNRDKCSWEWAENFPGQEDKTETILVDDCVYPYVDVIQAFISSGDHPSMVLLRRGLGEPCPAMYRILEFPQDDNNYVVSKSFGNCSPSPALFFDGKKLTIKLKSYYIHPDRYSSPGTWIYSHKKLREIWTTRRRK